MSFLMDDLFPSGLRTSSSTTTSTTEGNKTTFLATHHHHRATSGTGAAGSAGAAAAAAAAASSSAMELSENDSNIRLTMDLPGVRVKDIEVTVQRGVLMINGYRRTRSMDGKAIKKQKFSKRFAVDTDVVDMASATANLANGVLIVHAPKKSKPVVLKIKVTENEDVYDDDDDAVEEVQPSQQQQQQGDAVKDDSKKQLDHKTEESLQLQRRASTTGATSQPSTAGAATMVQFATGRHQSVPLAATIAHAHRTWAALQGPVMTRAAELSREAAAAAKAAAEEATLHVDGGLTRDNEHQQG